MPLPSGNQVKQSFCGLYSYNFAVVRSELLASQTNDGRIFSQKQRRAKSIAWINTNNTNGEILKSFSKVKLTSQVVCILSIVLPRGLIRLSSGTIIFSLFLYLIIYTNDSSKESYLAGVSCAGLVLRLIDLVGIHVPERDFWEKGSDKKDSPKTSL